MSDDTRAQPSPTSEPTSELATEAVSEPLSEPTSPSHIDPPADSGVTIDFEAIQAARDGTLVSAEPAAERSRRWPLVAGGLAVAAVVAGGLLVWHPWSRSDGGLPDGAIEADQGVLGTDGSVAPKAAAELTNKLIVGELPKGLTMQGGGTFDDTNRWGFDPNGNMPSVTLTKPDATFADGPWLTITSRALNRVEQRTWDPARETNPGAEKVSIGTAKGVFIDGWLGAGSQGLVFGPIEDLAITMQTKGLKRPQLLALARAVIVRDGKLAVNRTKEMDGWGVVPGIAMGNGGFGLDAAVPGGDGAQVSYGSANKYFGLLNRLADEATFATRVKFFLTGAKETTVHGKKAWVGNNGQQGFDNSIVAWIEGGREVVLSGGFKPDELTKLAETVRPATDDEWKKVVDVSRNGFQPVIRKPWLVASGDLPDTTTWVVEMDADTDEESIWLSASTLIGDGGMSGSGGESRPKDTAFVWAQQMGGTVIVAAYVPKGTDEAAVKITLPGGATTTIELGKNEHIAGLVGAVGILVPSGGGTMKAVLSDGAGKQLASVDAKLDGSQTNGGFAPAATEAPAVGG